MGSGPVVAIVGGAGGIGVALARCFGVRGAVVLLDRDVAALERARAGLTDCAAPVLCVPCDVTDPDTIAAAVARIREHHGRLDVLIYSAGLTHVSPFVDTDLAVYRRVMEVNFFGAVAMTKAALPMILESRGQVIILSSIAGFAPVLGRTGYCASKYALHGLFETLRAELKDRGVHVLMVCPSFVETDFARAGLDGDGTTLKFDRSTTGTSLTVEEVATAIQRAASTRRRLLVLGRTGKLAWWVSRLLPGLYERGMRRRFRIELERSGRGKA
jgi:NAD(P)-dependent dehydrogenase (short-subunit alcohol dehydrogenase family)